MRKLSDIIAVCLLVLLVVSCGSRKVVLNKENTETETHSEAEESEDTTTEQNVLSTSDIKIASDELGLSIEPIGGIPARFIFYYDGKKIEGETTGKMSFTSKKKQEDLQTKTEEKREIKEEKNVKIKEKKTEKREFKNKATERKTDWRLIVGIFLFIVAIWVIYKIKRR